LIMWRVSYLRAASDELDLLPALEQVAIQHAVEKLEVTGIRLPAPHCAPVKGVEGSWWELRPRRGNCPWRPIYTRIGADEFKIAAVAPDGETNPREFKRACQDAAERLLEWQEGKGR
jgi:hypothetical protein